MFDWLCPFPRIQANGEEFLVGVKQKTKGKPLVLVRQKGLEPPTLGTGIRLKP